MKKMIAAVVLLALLSAAVCAFAADRWTCEYCGKVNHRGFCTECGRSKAEATDKTAAACSRGEHSWDGGTVTTAATCSQQGTKTFTCTACRAKQTETVPKNSGNHTGGTEIRNAVAATCGKAGYSGDTYCKGCGTKTASGSTIAATGKHTWREATYDAPKTCTVCGVTEGSPLPRVTVGGYITFGHYPQSSAGNDSTPIEWLVLDVDKNANRALVISRYALDCVKYNTSYTSVTWEKSTIRTWLNGTFMNKAFSAAEQKAIVTAKVTADKNPYYNTAPGSDTHDEVFLLSITEAEKYFKDDNARRCAPTDYAIAQGVFANSNYKADGRATCWWWLRSPGGHSRYAAAVGNGGSIGDRGGNVNYDNAGARPALWIDLNLIP